MKIYHYNKNTFEYEKTSDAKIDPKNPRIFLIPKYATIIPPPINKNGKVAIFLNDEWIVVDKYVGIYYSKITGDEIIIDMIGDLPSYLTDKKPSSAFDVWNEMANDWIADESRKDQILSLIKNKYDSDCMFKITHIYLSIQDEKTFESLFNEIKAVVIDNAKEKNKLSSKTMQELIDIYSKF